MVSECIWLLLGRFIVLHNNGIPHYIHSILFTFYCMFVLHPPATCELELHLKWQIIFSFVGWRFVYLLNNFLIEIRFVELFCWVRFNSNVKHSITSFVQCSMQWYLHALHECKWLLLGVQSIKFGRQQLNIWSDFESNRIYVHNPKNDFTSKTYSYFTQSFSEFTRFPVWFVDASCSRRYYLKNREVLTMTVFFLNPYLLWDS